MGKVVRKKIFLVFMGVLLLGLSFWGIQWVTYARPPLPAAVAERYQTTRTVYRNAGQCMAQRATPTSQSTGLSFE